MIEYYGGFLNYIVSKQQELNLLISDYFDRLDSGESMVFFSILFVSFIYGLVHALGPGHGKMVIASYFLAKEAKIKEAFKAGFLTSIIHTISALLITGVLYLFFQRAVTKHFQDINANMYKISAVFIILIALYLLYEVIKDRNEEEKVQRLKSKNLLAVSLSIGIVPCPGVMTIVLFSMILGYINLGILSAITMSIGMGLTISLAAILATQVKNKRFSKYKYFMNILTYGAIVLLISLGVFLLV
ncbi:nickel/cobalt transporter [Arcobacter roscoffensis]|uniref:Nickel/cobalt efflux system n=1 Tax=Arcobacter roscoffensis TaxID=2961520 RepID=A0ABY5E4E9_9BACT|nr:high frequency lysogenization protein HflD [Arcobacter roscoffensis]UTJ07036.1 high frequency lysogenization protein HflD [Arcobacter roscoffensis]